MLAESDDPKVVMLKSHVMPGETTRVTKIACSLFRVVSMCVEVACLW